MESLLYLGLLIGLLYWTFLKVKRRASGSTSRRRSTLIRSLLQLAVGLVIAFWLPTRVPDTPGSPAALVMLVLSWLLGGAMAVTAMIGVVAALLARRE